MPSPCPNALQINVAIASQSSLTPWAPLAAHLPLYWKQSSLLFTPSSSPWPSACRPPLHRLRKQLGRRQQCDFWPHLAGKSCRNPNPRWGFNPGRRSRSNGLRLILKPKSVRPCGHPVSSSVSVQSAPASNQRLPLVWHVDKSFVLI
jgi:hypothetical protein